MNCPSCGHAHLRGCLPPDLKEGELSDDELDYFRRLRPEGWRRCLSCEDVVHADTLAALDGGDRALAVLRELDPTVAQA